MKFIDLTIKFVLKFFKMAACQGVMLGVPDEMIPFEVDISIGWTTNKFGGLPNWMSKPPDHHNYPQCDLCGRHLPLVTQIYCPLENSSYHRVLYIFGCTSISCWNKNESWKVLRCQSLVRNDEFKDRRQKQEEKLDTWCDDADNWGDEEILDETSSTSEVKQLEEQTRNLKLNEDESPKHKSSASINQSIAREINTQVFVPYYITAIEESHVLAEAAELTRSEKRLLDEYRAKEGAGDIGGMLDEAKGGKWGGEKYEMSVAKHGDKIFQKFRKQLSLCPNQCLRYSWNGEPIPMTSQALGSIPSCPLCGQKRVFELQVMPALVSLLKTYVGMYNSRKDSCSEQYTDCNNTSSHIYIEFGTVFVYTCSQGCWSEDAKYCDEYVIVHGDPDQHLFKSVR